MRQLLPKVLQPTENPLKLLVMGGKSFPNFFKNNMFIYIFFWDFFRENFTYLSAPYRAAAAPKGAPTHWSCWQREQKVFRNVWKNIQIYFLQIFFQYIFAYLAAPHRAAAAPKGAPTHLKSTEAVGGGGKCFPKNYEKNIFICIIFWENFSRKCHLPSCSLSCGSCSQRCFNPLKIDCSCRCWE